MSRNFLRKAAFFACLLFILMISQGQSYAQCAQTANTWCTVAAAPSNTGTMLLLTDGRVMVEKANLAGGCGQAWMILTPDSTGNYATGTWTTTAAMSTPRLYFASTVLPDGRVWVMGGEYTGAACSSGVANDSNTGEIYDPVANTWSAIATYPNSSFGDDPSELLPNGNILAGDIGSWVQHIYNISTNSWTGSASKVYTDSSDEEGWVKLSNGNIITYDIFRSVSQGSGYAEEYNPGTNLWASISPADSTANGTLPLLTSSALGDELGPLMRLQDGRILVIGANQHTALYTAATNTWAAGPNTIGPAVGGCASSCAFGADDAPASELPTGHVIFAADAGPTLGTFSAPTYLFDFNPGNGTTTLLSPQPPSLTAGNGISSFFTRMLMLPTGQLLFSDGSTIHIYTPTSTTAALPYRPIVQGVTAVGTLFTLTGLQLNGQSAGSYYGDDVVTDENYPIVRLVASGVTVYCKTTNWSSVAVGAVGTETVNFTIPHGTSPGNYSLIVSGAGVQGAPIAVNITASEIP